MNFIHRPHPTPISWLLAVLIGFSLWACGDRDNDEDARFKGKQAATAEDTLHHSMQEGIFLDFDLLSMKPAIPMSPSAPQFPHISVVHKTPFLVLTSHFSVHWHNSHYVFRSGNEYIWADTIVEPADPQTAWLQIYVPRRNFLGMLKYIGQAKAPYNWELFEAQMIYPDLRRREYTPKDAFSAPLYQLPLQSDIAMECETSLKFSGLKTVESVDSHSGLAMHYSQTRYIPRRLSHLPTNSLYWFFLERSATLRPFPE